MRHHPHDHEHDQHEHRGRDRGELGWGPRGRGRGPRTRRGDIRIALLSALNDGPGHGYDLIGRLEERTGGRWRPSPGSVYPTLQLLEDSGFVTSSQQADKKVFAITDAGRAEMARLLEQVGPPAWTEGDAGAHGGLRRSMMQLALATKQIGMAGNASHVEAATAILDDARRKLYQLLAEG